jgi:hypothetical protein
MKIARYWQKATAPVRLASGRSFDVAAWGWSQSSVAEAQERAREAANRFAHWLQTKPAAPRGNGYYDNPPREEIVREIAGANGETAAILTRNSYGALVLNTPHLMFIDIDIPPDAPFGAFKRRLQKLFGRAGDEPEAGIRKRITEVAAQHKHYSFRVYRTAAGFRCMLLNEVLAPESTESRHLLEQFGADALYQKLCRTQECYRARLTPKFWRLSADGPPNRFPWEMPEHEQTYREWQASYEKQCEASATCRFVEQIGTHAALVELEPLVALHDEVTRANSDLKLA